MTKKLLALSGIGEDRLHLAWVSSAEAQRFVEVVTNTTEAIKALGAFDAGAFEDQLAAAEKTLSGETLRWIVGKELKVTTKGDVYGRKWDTDSYESILDSVLEREYQKNLILQAIKADCTSVRTIKDKIGLDLGRISYLLADMEKTNMVRFTEMKDNIPVFTALV
jgi:methyl-viologen-reducing hydrogenase delta subunit